MGLGLPQPIGKMFSLPHGHIIRSTLINCFVFCLFLFYLISNWRLKGAYQCQLYGQLIFKKWKLKQNKDIFEWIVGNTSSLHMPYRLSSHSLSRPDYFLNTPPGSDHFLLHPSQFMVHKSRYRLVLHSLNYWWHMHPTRSTLLASSSDLQQSAGIMATMAK